MEVIVIGAGIGGLSMALSLHQIGIPVRVYEAAREVTPLGVGINLQPNAVRELTELGLAEQLAAVGIATQELRFYNKYGQLIWREPRGRAAGFAWPQYSIHRGQLQMLLCAATRERIGAENIHTGFQFTGFSQNENRVIASFINREAGGAPHTDESDILIAADGIHSAVRRQLYPAEGAPDFAGQLVWRAATQAAPILDGRTMIIAGNFHQRFVAYPIGHLDDTGRMLTNWIAQMSIPDVAPPREDWNRKVTKERFYDAFGAWKFPWLDVPHLIEQTEQVFEFPLVDRNPVGRWSFGRVTLIGDAAHPMHPTGSQAGSQAIIDARALTAALLSTTDPVDALEHYDAQRRPAMNEITLRNRQFGPELAMQLVEERAPGGFSRVEDVISQDELSSITQSFSQAAGLDPDTVNNRPSFVPPNRT
jgi:2-polyprenyl-6-methoxyphenol hydroxylase-like FAD-dependent oxidoreductase